MSGNNIRKCRYINCKHITREIDITLDDYVRKGTFYYHPDCYKSKVAGDWKDEQTKKDLAEFRNLWYHHISKTVNYSQLMRILNEYILRGISSDYLLFVLRYCIDKKKNLNYPNGFKYFVDKQEIKTAYDRYLLNKQKAEQKKIEINRKKDDSPKFNVQQKQRGFQSVFEK